MKTLRILVAALGLTLALGVPAQSLVKDNYNKTEVYITMRDGAKLFTSIYTPKDTSQAWPFLMQRTPYSCRPYGAEAFRNNLGPESNFANLKYIFVYQDVRGRYMSDGSFKWMTPFIPNKEPGQVDESTDTWDSIEWLLKNIPNNNGKVGIYGTSFPGHYAAQALIDPHPALKAASPQAPMADNWLGDDMHHGGTFFLPHAMNFIAGFGKKREGPTQDYGPRVFSHGTPDGYRFFLEMGPLPNANKLYLKDQIELWNLWMKHGDYDEYWQAQNVPQHLKKLKDVAVLLVGGWWDAEDLAGPLAIYQAIEKFNPINDTRIVMGPWYHGSWNGGPGDALHDITWSTKTGEDFRTKIQAPFFEHYLKGGPKPEIAEATMFDVGADEWRESPTWPPTYVVAASLHPQKGGDLVWGAAEAKPVYDEYLSDPWKPVPASAAISTGMPRQYMIEDQRFVWNRPDVLAYETEPLAEDVTLTGPITASLFVSTTGTDADFVVKLIDVYPNDSSKLSPRTGAGAQMSGYQMLVRGEPMRAKYRKSWSKPEPLKPNAVEKVEFTLPDVCYTFKQGHKIMLQVHSSWFPVVDRNPQRFVNIYEAKESDFQKAMHRLYLGGDPSTALKVSVLPRK